MKRNSPAITNPTLRLPRRQARCGGFTLLEILVGVAIIAILALSVATVYPRLVNAGRKGKSISNLRLIATANLSYAAQHDGYYCPAQDRKNRTRWHGGRKSGSGAFDPTKGFLSPYMGDSGRVEACPAFLALARSQKGMSSFEVNSGGYGYNATYVGGTPANMYQGASNNEVRNPARTVMFTTTALAKGEGLQEYPFSEPYYAPTRRGGRGSDLQPSTHFRFDGKAAVAWCDGRVTLEEPSTLDGPNFYGGDNVASVIGWFGPGEENGYWNPNSPVARGE